MIVLHEYFCILFKLWSFSFFCRLHFAPLAEYDSTSALFNGDMIDMSSIEINENNTIDPIIDVAQVTESVKSSSLDFSQRFTPIVTAPSAALPEDLLHPKPSSAVTVTPSLPQVKLEPTVPVENNHLVDSVVSVSNSDSRRYNDHHKELMSLKVNSISSFSDFVER